MSSVESVQKRVEAKKKLKEVLNQCEIKDCSMCNEIKEATGIKK